MDDKIEGVSTDLLLLDPPRSARPGMSVNIVFQAVDDEGTGVPHQELELIITDPSRLTFVDAPATDHYVVSTKQEDRAGGLQVVGAAVIPVAVPATAAAGTVTLVGSLEGARGNRTKTRYVTLTVDGEPVPDAGPTPPAPDGGLGDPAGGDGPDSGGDGGGAGQE